MSKVDLIYQAIKTGVSAPKIIAKYGKKAYTKATKWIRDNPDKSFKAWATGSLGTTGLTAIGITIADKYKKKKEKYNPRLKRGLRSGGSVNSRAIAKKYFKGGMV